MDLAITAHILERDFWMTAKISEMDCSDYKPLTQVKMNFSRTT